MFGDRFYNPPAVRRQQQLQRNRGNGGNPAKSKTVSGIRLPESRVESNINVPGKQVPEEDSDVCSPSADFHSGNLDRFLQATSPSVPAQYFPKTATLRWGSGDVEFHPFFTLGDLWESFKEWSAYGAGVPLVLNGSDSVVQYYVPYLSAIQLYADSSSSPPSKPRLSGEESDRESYQETSSDGSSDLDYEKSLKSSNNEAWRWHYSSSEVNMPRMEREYGREKSSISQEGFSSDDGDISNSTRDCLIFEFFEHNPPFNRQPLADKILDLVGQFPNLKTLRSCDLLSASWISVAWYPIYRIPMGPTLRDLDACFLTFHSLSTPFKGAASDLAQMGCIHATRSGSVSAPDMSPTLSLPIFGLASYKFKSSVWMPTGAYERQQASSLLQAADNWLRLRQVSHPDFLFFVSHGTYRR